MIAERVPYSLFQFLASLPSTVEGLPLINQDWSNTEPSPTDRFQWVFS